MFQYTEDQQNKFLSNCRQLFSETFYRNQTQVTKIQNGFKCKAQQIEQSGKTFLTFSLNKSF